MQLDLSEFKGQQQYSSYEIAFHLSKRTSLPKRAKKYSRLASLRGLTRRRKYGAWGAEHEPAAQGYTLGSHWRRGLFAGYAENARGASWDAHSAQSGF
jgi:hypothetical protein